MRFKNNKLTSGRSCSTCSRTKHSELSTFKEPSYLITKFLPLTRTKSFSDKNEGDIKELQSQRFYIPKSFKHLMFILDVLFMSISMRTYISKNKLTALVKGIARIT